MGEPATIHPVTFLHDGSTEGVRDFRPRTPVAAPPQPPARADDLGFVTDSAYTAPSVADVPPGADEPSEPAADAPEPTQAGSGEGGGDDSKAASVGAPLPPD